MLRVRGGWDGGGSFFLGETSQSYDGSLLLLHLLTIATGNDSNVHYNFICTVNCLNVPLGFLLCSQ